MNNIKLSLSDNVLLSADIKIPCVWSCCESCHNNSPHIRALQLGVVLLHMALGFCPFFLIDFNKVKVGKVGPPRYSIALNTKCNYYVILFEWDTLVKFLLQRQKSAVSSPHVYWASVIKCSSQILHLPCLMNFWCEQTPLNVEIAAPAPRSFDVG